MKMTQLQLLNKRQHVMAYDTVDVPEKQLIEDLLWKAWKVTPSKNNKVDAASKINSRSISEIIQNSPAQSKTFNISDSEIDG